MQSGDRRQPDNHRDHSQLLPPCDRKPHSPFPRWARDLFSWNWWSSGWSWWIWVHGRETSGCADSHYRKQLASRTH